MWQEGVMGSAFMGSVQLADTGGISCADPLIPSQVVLAELGSAVLAVDPFEAL